MREKFLPFACFIAFVSVELSAQQKTISEFPVRAISISAPTPSNIDSFLVFINTELAPRRFNTIFLLVDYNYQFISHPELAIKDALSKTDVQRIKAACDLKNIRIIPHINLLGHQSWANHNTKLLEVYPDFDETPWIKMPQYYVWPNADSL